MRTSRTTSLCPSALLLLVIAVGQSTALVWSGTDFRWASQCDFINRDFLNQPSSSDQCGPLCKANPSCSHFTWTNYQGGTCWMKTGVASEFDAISKFNDGAICGYIKSTVGQPPASAWNDAGSYKWALQCDFVNRDFMSKATTVDTCASSCQSTSGCSHFTWTNYQGGTCWMKTGGASECDAIVKTDWSPLCGFLKF